MKKFSDILSESKEEYGIYKDEKVRLNYPEKLRSSKKQFVVYRPTDKKDEESGLPKAFAVKYSDPNSTIKNDDKDRVDSFWARHNCADKKDKDTAGYWACYTPEKHGKRLGLKGGNSRW